MSRSTPASRTSATSRHPAPTTIAGRVFDWSARTYVMGIVNVTPDSFSGDGLLAEGFSVGPTADPAVASGVIGWAVPAAVAEAREMIAAGADILDVGGESTRPGHVAVDAQEEAARVTPVVAAIHAAFPEMPISIDTSMARLAGERQVPMIVMHNRAEAAYADLVAEVVADLRGAVDRAVRLGVRRENLIVDPGFGFGKTPEQNLVILRELGALGPLDLPVLLGASRKSTLGRVLGGLGPADRLEATLATTALGIAFGANMVRVHDVAANVRVARVCDAVMRGALP